MPVYDDHPVRVLMRQHGIRRAALSKASGVSYPAIDKLTMGMTKTVHPDIAAALAKLTGTPPKTLHAQVAEWNERPLFDKLPPRTQAMLLYVPDDVAAFYPSFQAWREEFAENPTQFASLVRMPRASLVEYETGRRKGFPRNLRDALARTFNLGEAYLDALEALPPSDTDPRVAVGARIVTLPNPPHPTPVPTVQPEENP
jgi:hypothetical protein